MSSLPSRAKALATLRKAGCPNKVIKHSLLVAKIAEEIVNSINPKINVDYHLVEIGALLHDIGRSITHGVEHGCVGAAILEELGYPGILVGLVRNHVGAGIPRKEAIALGLPPRDYLPATAEEKVVCYADKLARGSVRISFEEALKAFAADLGSHHPGLARFRRLHEEIVGLARGADGGTCSSRKDPSGKR